MKATISYTNGDSDETYNTIQAAALAILSQYPDGVIYDAGGFERTEHSPDNAYDIRDGRAALVWRNEAESVNDDGSRAIASINV